MNEHTRAKRNELKTYRELGLNRDRKFYNRLQNKKRVLGGEDATQPAIVVNEADYISFWKTAAQATLVEYENVNLPREALWKMLYKKIEARAYEIALQSYIIKSSVDQKCRQIGVKPWSLSEQKKYLNHEIMEQKKTQESSQYTLYRGALLDEVLSKIEAQVSKRPQSLQAAWLQAVGKSLAQHSQIKKIDEEREMIFVRVMNPTMGHHLRQQKALYLKKLESILNMRFKHLIIQS